MLSIDTERFFYDPNNIVISPSSNLQKRWLQIVKFTEDHEYIFDKDIFRYKYFRLPFPKSYSPRIIDLQLGNGNTIQIVVFLHQILFLGYIFIGVTNKGCGFFSLNSNTTPKEVKKKLKLKKEDINNMVDWINTQTDEEEFEQVGTYLDEMCIDRLQES